MPSLAEIFQGPSSASRPLSDIFSSPDEPIAPSRQRFDQGPIDFNQFWPGGGPTIPAHDEQTDFSLHRPAQAMGAMGADQISLGSDMVDFVDPFKPPAPPSMGRITTPDIFPRSTPPIDAAPLDAPDATAIAQQNIAKRQSLQQDVARWQTKTKQWRSKMDSWLSDSSKWENKDYANYYENYLPVKMTPDILADPELTSKYARINELITGEPFLAPGLTAEKYARSKEQVQADKLLMEADAKVRGTEPDAFTWVAGFDEANADNLGTVAGKALVQGVKRPALGLLEMAGAGHANEVRTQDLMAQYQDVVQGLKDDKSLWPSARRWTREGAQTVGQMAPSLLVGYLTGNPAAGINLMGGQVGLQEFANKRANGWDVPSSLAYGYLSGLVEAGTEYLGAGVGTSLGLETVEQTAARGLGQATEHSIFSGVKNKTVKKTLEAIGSAALEGGEETLADVLHAVKDTGFGLDPQGVQLDSFIVGALVGMGSQGVSTTAGALANRFLSRPSQKSARAAGIVDEVAPTQQAREKIADTVEEVIGEKSPDLLEQRRQEWSEKTTGARAEERSLAEDFYSNPQNAVDWARSNPELVAKLAKAGDYTVTTLRGIDEALPILQGRPGDATLRKAWKQAALSSVMDPAIAEVYSSLQWKPLPEGVQPPNHPSIEVRMTPTGPYYKIHPPTGQAGIAAPNQQDPQEVAPVAAPVEEMPPAVDSTVSAPVQAAQAPVDNAAPAPAAPEPPATAQSQSGLGELGGKAVVDSMYEGMRAWIKKTGHTGPENPAKPTLAEQLWQKVKGIGIEGDEFVDTLRKAQPAGVAGYESLLNYFQGVARTKAASADPDVDRWQRIIDKAAPEGGGKVARKNGVVQVAYGGKTIDLREAPEVTLNPKQLADAMANYGMADTPENRKQFLEGIKAKFLIRTQTGRLYKAPYLIALREGLDDAEAATWVRHELLHFARQTGLIGNEEWAKLVDKHAKGVAGEGSQQEAINAALQSDPGFIRKAVDFIDGLLEGMGVNTSELRKIERRLRSGKQLAQEQSTTTTQPGKEATRGQEETQTKAQAEAGQTVLEKPQPAAETAPPAVSRDYGTAKEPNRAALGEHFGERLANGARYEKITDARKEASELVGGKIGAGTLATKAVDEAVEVGVVRAARQIIAEAKNSSDAYDKLVDLYDRQPSLGTRTSTSMLQQAYSTPAPLAFLAQNLAGVGPDTVVYDSAAGNGMLLTASKNALANELNPERAEALIAQGITTTEEDATEFSPDKPIDAVVINPPFGRVTEGGKDKFWNVDGVKTDQVDHAIALKTLESLPDDGKAVLIVGSKGFEAGKPKADVSRSMAYSSNPAKRFYDRLYDEYNVVDHFTVGGDLYTKQGAGFPVDVIVIDGRGKSERAKPWNFKEGGLPEPYYSWEALKDAKLDNRPASRSASRPARPADQREAAPQTDVGTVPQPARPAAQPNVATDEGERTGPQSGTPARGGSEVGDGLVDQESVGPPEPGPGQRRAGQPGADAEQLSEEGAAEPGLGTETPRGVERGGLAERASVKPGDAETEHQVTYVPRSGSESVGTLLPKNHVSAVSRALDEIEQLHGDIDKFVGKSLAMKPAEMRKAFSAEQVDALAMAIHNHEKGLAFVLGDQTGVGKGRVVAAMMRYAKQQGLLPVFITEKPTLYADMMRDLTDIGMNPEAKQFNPLITNALTGEDKVDLNTNIAGRDPRVASQTGPTARKRMQEAIANFRKDGTLKSSLRSKVETHDAIFTTYAQLSPIKGEETWRHQALNSIAPRAFLILDESHNAGGSGKTADPNEEEQSGQDWGDDEKVKRSELIRHLVASVANVMYSSATFAKRPGVMDLYGRAGLALAVANPADLPQVIAEGGVPLQQVVSEMMAEGGLMLRRERSFDGVQFTPKVVDVGLEKADAVSGVFRSIHKFSESIQDAIAQIEEEIVSQGGELGDDEATGTAGVESTNFTSLIWNITDQMLLSLKSDAVADAAIESFNSGEAPVVVVDNTMESALDRYLEENPAKVGDPIEFSFRDLLRHYLERSREILIKEDRDDPKTWIRRYLSDEEIGPEALGLYGSAANLIEGFTENLPASPIDWIRHRLEKAGINVAEITGRDNIINYVGGMNSMELDKRPEGEIGNSGKSKSVSDFNSGKLKALLLNRSGSTGLSIHASEKFTKAGQKQRHMIIAQAAKNIDEFVQMLGRVHRTGQVNKPKYTLFLTNAPAENRPAAVLVKKLGSLNASVTASSSGSVNFDVPDIINQIGDRVVAGWMSENAWVNQELGNPVEFNKSGEIANPSGVAKKVSGRMAMMPIDMQTHFWDEIIDGYNALIAELDAQDANPLTAKTLDLGAKTAEKFPISEGDPDNPNPFAQPAYLERIDAKMTGKPLMPEEVSKAVKEFYGGEPREKIADWKRTTAEDTRQRGLAWLKDRQGEITKRAEKQDQAAQIAAAGRVEMMQETAKRQFAAIHQAINLFPVGQSVSIRLNEEQVSGIVTGFKIAKKGNILAPSKSSIEIALADSLRKLTLPLSRLTGEDLELVPAGGFMSAATLQEFKDAGGIRREQRYVGTGNLLRAFSELSDSGGRVAFFTDAAGAIRRGVLLPRRFNPAAWEAERPFVFSSGGETMKFLKNGGNASTADGVLLISHIGSNLVFVAPKARSRGGAYTANDALLKAAGQEFVSKGARMEMLIPDGPAQTKALEAVMQVSDIQTKNKDLAYQATGRQRPQIAAQQGGGKTSAASRGRATDAGAARELPPSEAPLDAGNLFSPPGESFGPAQIKRVPLPEMLQLAKDLLGGKLPEVRKLGEALGRFRAAEGEPQTRRILMDPRTARNEHELAAVLAHEIGHVIDYLPDATLKRGNILGRLASIGKYLKGYLDGVGNNRVIRNELIDLTKWWRGDYEKAEDSQYTKYRESARELYADALSVLFNEPAELAARAPNFWKGFTENIDAKPDVLRSLLETQTLLDGTPEDLAADRAERIIGMFASGQQALTAGIHARRAANVSSIEGAKQALEQYLIDRNGPMRKREAAARRAGADINAAQSAYHTLDELNYRDRANHQMLTRIEREFYHPAMEQGFDKHGDIGQFLFLRRIVNERNQILNPLGFTPIEAAKQLQQLKQQLGPEKFRRLEGAMGLWHDIVFDQVKRAVAAGVYSQENFDTKIAPNKDNYAAFAVVHYLEENPHISAGIRQQVGTFNDVANPLDATTLKMMTLNRLTDLNIAKAKVRDSLQAYSPDEIKAVKVPHGEWEPTKPAAPGMAYMIVLEDGTPHAYEVPKAIANVFLSHNVGGAAKAAQFLSNEVYGVWHPLFVTFNPSFMAQNAPRDLRRTWQNLYSIGNKAYGELVKGLIASGKTAAQARALAKKEKITLAQVLKSYWNAKGAAWHRAAGLQDATIERMINEAALTVPFVSIDPNQIEDEGNVQYLLAQHGLSEGKENPPAAALWRALAPVLGNIPMVSQIGAQIGGAIKANNEFWETIGKVGPNQLLQEKGYGRQERSFITRKYVGTPDYMQKGLATVATNALLMYQKVRNNGLEWDGHLATTAGTRGSYWFQRALGTLLPTTINKAAAYGLLGLGAKAAMDAIPKYFFENYDVIPIGALLGGDDEDKKKKRRQVFLTIAQDDTGRFIKRLWSHILDFSAQQAGMKPGDTRSASSGSIVHSFLGDVQDETIGNLNPPLDLALRWSQFAGGMNPQDPHFNSNIIPDRQWQAGGLEQTKAMLSWSLNKFGVLSTLAHSLTAPTVGSPFEEGQETPVQTVARSVPGLSAILRVSDRGYSEQQYAEIEAEETERAEFKLGLPPESRTATSTLYRLQRQVDELGKDETDQKLVLQKWYNQAYLPITKSMREEGADLPALRKELADASKDFTAQYIGAVATDKVHFAALSEQPRRKKNDGKFTETVDEWHAHVAQWKQNREQSIAWIKDHRETPQVAAALAAFFKSRDFHDIANPPDVKFSTTGKVIFPDESPSTIQRRARANALRKELRQK